MNQLERLADLEAKVASLERLVSGMTSSIAVVGQPRELRLAKVVPGPEGGDYTTGSGVPNVYWVKLVDATFTDEISTQSVTSTDRSEEPKIKARTLWDSYIPEDTYVLVARIRNRWWILNNIPLAIGKTLADDAEADPPVEGAIDKGASGTVELYNPYDRTATGHQVEAYNLFADVVADRWVALMNLFGTWYLIAAECVEE